MPIEDTHENIVTANGTFRPDHSQKRAAAIGRIMIVYATYLFPARLSPVCPDSQDVTTELIPGT